MNYENHPVEVKFLQTANIGENYISMQLQAEHGLSINSALVFYVNVQVKAGN